MFALALTGSIATGKSTVLDMFSDENIPTLSSDMIVHELYENAAVAPISKLFPRTVKQGKIDRKILTQIIQKNPNLLKKLEEIVHPLVRQKQLEFLQKNRLNGEKLVVIEIPLLFETNSKLHFDAIVVTICPKDIQRKRALKREGMSEEKLELILANQISQQEKIKQADFIIDSSKTLDQMRKQVKKIISETINK